MLTAENNYNKSNQEKFVDSDKINKNDYWLKEYQHKLITPLIKACFESNES